MKNAGLPVAVVAKQRLWRRARSPEIALTNVGERYWLLRVDPKGRGVGEGVPILQIGWPPQKLVFAARGGGPF